MKHQFIIFYFYQTIQKLFYNRNQFILKLLIHIKINKKIRSIKMQDQNKAPSVLQSTVQQGDSLQIANA